MGADRSHRLSDAEYRQISEAYNRFFAKLEESHATYVSILRQLNVSGLVAGHVADNMRHFRRLAMVPMNDIDTAGRVVHEETERFLSDVHIADLLE